MALIDEVRTLKAQGLTVDQIIPQLSKPAPYWLVKVLYNIA